MEHILLTHIYAGSVQEMLCVAKEVGWSKKPQPCKVGRGYFPGTKAVVIKKKIMPIG